MSWGRESVHCPVMQTPALSTSDAKALDSLTPHQLLDEIRQLREQYVREVPGGRRSWPESIRARVLALGRLGVPVAKVAGATGISRATVFLWCQGGPPRKRGRPPGQGARFIELEPPAAQSNRQTSPVVRLDSGTATRIATEATRELRLRLPNGYEFMGLQSVQDAVSLFQALEQLR